MISNVSNSGASSLPAAASGSRFDSGAVKAAASDTVFLSSAGLEAASSGQSFADKDFRELLRDEQRRVAQQSAYGPESVKKAAASFAQRLAEAAVARALDPWENIGRREPEQTARKPVKHPPKRSVYAQALAAAAKGLKLGDKDGDGLVEQTRAANLVVEELPVALTDSGEQQEGQQAYSVESKSIMV